MSFFSQKQIKKKSEAWPPARGKTRRGAGEPRRIKNEGLFLHCLSEDSSLNVFGSAGALGENQIQAATGVLVDAREFYGELARRKPSGQARWQISAVGKENQTAADAP